MDLHEIKAFALSAALVLAVGAAGTAFAADEDRAPLSGNELRNAGDWKANANDELDAGAHEDADLALSQEIRRKVAANMTLSAVARNVEIDTRDGVVTLRGPVRSDEEKTYIGTVAQATTGVQRVDNLLEIEPAEK